MNTPEGKPRGGTPSAAPFPCRRCSALSSSRTRCGEGRGEASIPPSLLPSPDPPEAGSQRGSRRGGGRPSGAVPGGTGQGGLRCGAVRCGGTAMGCPGTGRLSPSVGGGAALCLLGAWTPPLTLARDTPGEGGDGRRAHHSQAPADFYPLPPKITPSAEPARRGPRGRQPPAGNRQAELHRPFPSHPGLPQLRPSLPRRQPRRRCAPAQLPPRAGATPGAEPARPPGPRRAHVCGTPRRDGSGKGGGGKAGEQPRPPRLRSPSAGAARCTLTPRGLRVGVAGRAARLERRRGGKLRGAR